MTELAFVVSCQTALHLVTVSERVRAGDRQALRLAVDERALGEQGAAVKNQGVIRG
jgi:hypothetical protein